MEEYILIPDGSRLSNEPSKSLSRFHVLHHLFEWHNHQFRIPVFQRLPDVRLSSSYLPMKFFFTCARFSPRQISGLVNFLFYQSDWLRCFTNHVCWFLIFPKAQKRSRFSDPATLCPGGKFKIGNQLRFYKMCSGSFRVQYFINERRFVYFNGFELL